MLLEAFNPGSLSKTGLLSMIVAAERDGLPLSDTIVEATERK